MKRSKPIYIIRMTDWDTTEIVKAYEKKEDAQRHCDSANAQLRPSYGKLYSVERVNFIYEA